MCQCYGVGCGRDGEACLRFPYESPEHKLEKEKKHVAACLDHYLRRACELKVMPDIVIRGSYIDLGERRPDGTPRTSYERWPNGAPT